ncbi:hypothetical protein [Brachybacterium kimchii]|uniref:Uncharacterized protein n=1 Tax=Brachybacterium kimchii TaxID=2942909 RepID=A0ABY4N1C2_9MICO|nr:hypothetical protein [Brachybacterium kimchii]UQN28333.1 hypothetical protein M4486_11825 [Brachybacterium kimchii]
MGEADVAAALTRGPRGLRTLLEFALRSEDAAMGDDVGPLAVLVHDAAHHRDDSSFAAMITEEGRVVPNLEVPDPGMDEVADALDSVVLLLEPSHDLMLRCVADAVTEARYWQAPAGSDAVAMTAPVRRALHRVADRLASERSVRDWWSDMDADHQVHVLWIDPDAPESFVGRAPRPSVEDLRADAARSGDVAMWESAPTSFRAMTTGRWPDGTPTHLWLVEDEQGWTEAFADPVESAAGRDVLEIRSAQDWVALCRRHPQDVTRMRRETWGPASGHEGAWVQPSWAAISRTHDAVHLGLGAYLDLAGRAIDVDGRSATMVAGWHPDATYWFREPPDPIGAPEPWRFVDTEAGAGGDDLAWMRAEHAARFRTVGT